VHVFGPRGVLPDVKVKRSRDRAAEIEDVRCLSCTTVYERLAHVGVGLHNRACPRCGYAGWVPASVPVTAQSSLPRFSGNRLRVRRGRPG
jgi:hypothetical protein